MERSILTYPLSTYSDLSKKLTEEARIERKYDVIIIGGGPNGLVAGSYLAKAGQKVLVLEKESQIAGRAFSTKYRGQVVDHGIHAPLRTGYLEEIFSRLGKPYPELVPWTILEVYHEGKWQDINDLYPHPELRKIIGG